MLDAAPALRIGLPRSPGSGGPSGGAAMEAPDADRQANDTGSAKAASMKTSQQNKPMLEGDEWWSEDDHGVGSVRYRSDGRAFHYQNVARVSITANGRFE